MSKLTLRAVALSLALTTGAAGLMQAAQAQAPADSPATTTQPAHGPQGHDGFRGHGPRHGFGPAASPFMVLPRLEHRLKLTESQQTLFRAAKSQGREAGKAMRTQFMQDRQALRQQLDAGSFDLRAYSAKEDAARAAVAPQMKAARDAWLAAYDALDAQQKQIVADAVKRGMEHRGHRSFHHGDKAQQGAKPAQS